jgi:hypothetical protein
MILLFAFIFVLLTVRLESLVRHFRYTGRRLRTEFAFDGRGVQLFAALSLRQAIDVVKEKVVLSNIVGAYVKDMRPYGACSFQCLCPFHDDRSPSMSFSDDKGLFFCFACSVGGDMFQFVERIEQCSFEKL